MSDFGNELARLIDGRLIRAALVLCVAMVFLTWGAMWVLGHVHFNWNIHP